MTAELVSVVIASYNMGHYLAEAIDSVLAQDYSPLQVIVVDDGSTDDTERVLERYAHRDNVQVIRQANGGQTSAKNCGLSVAAGKYVGFCDADNAWTPGKVSRQVGLFDEEKRIGVVYGDVTLIDGAGRDLPTPRVKRYSGRVTRPLLLDNFVTFNTALVLRSAIVECGGFDRSLKMGIDYDLWLRISTAYEFRYVSEVFARYRVWEGQMSRNVERRFESAFRIMEKFVANYPGAVSDRDRRVAWAYSLVSRARWRFGEGMHQAAWSDLRSALGYRFSDRRAWVTVLSFLLSGHRGQARDRA